MSLVYEWFSLCGKLGEPHQYSFFLSDFATAHKDLKTNGLSLLVQTKNLLDLQVINPNLFSASQTCFMIV